MSSAWGMLLTIEFVGGNALVSSPRAIKAWFAETIAIIGMEPLTGPILASAQTPKPGWSCVQIIATSHVSAHFEDSGLGMIDIFSCKEFDARPVAELTQNKFEPKLLNWNVHYRFAPEDSSGVIE